MPIYAYRCDSCGFSKDALQKISDAPLTQCPSCHKDTFKKQLTAASFQLKGSGWYVTDFRNADGHASHEEPAPHHGHTHPDGVAGANGTGDATKATDAASATVPATPSATPAATTAATTKETTSTAG
ncbi:MAG: FmdB family zinc ribbon protein [Herbaspirillum sp.]